MQNFLRPVKLFRFDNPQIRTVSDHPVFFLFLRPLSSQEVRHFLFPVHNLARIQLIRENPAYGILAPTTAALRLFPTFIQHIGYFTPAVALFGVPPVNLPDDCGFLLVNRQIEVVANGLIVAIYDVRHTSFLRIDFLAEFHTFGSIQTFFLRQCSEYGQYKLAVPHARHIGGQKLRLYPQRFRIFWSKSTVLRANLEISFTTTMSNRPCSASAIMRRNSLRFFIFVPEIPSSAYRRTRVSPVRSVYSAKNFFCASRLFNWSSLSVDTLQYAAIFIANNLSVCSVSFCYVFIILCIALYCKRFIWISDKQYHQASYAVSLSM